MALLFWFFGDFRCGALLFMVIHVIYKHQNSAESGVAPAPGWGGGVGGGAQVQHQLQLWAKYWYSIVWDVLTQSIYKG